MRRPRRLLRPRRHSPCARLLWIPGAAIPGLGLGLAAQADPAPALEPLRAEVASLALEAELAAGSDFYLVLDRGTPSLTLYHQGTALRRYEVSGLAVGRARRFFAPARPLDLGGRIWSGARLAPERRVERVEMVSDEATPPDPTGAVSWVPPAPHELNPTPAVFRVRYADGLSIEIRAERASASGEAAGPAPRRAGIARRLAWWLADRAVLLVPGGGGQGRLRIAMPADEAGALYRSLPAGSRLLIRGA